MIVAWLYNALKALLVGLLGLFPAWSFPVDLSGAGDALGSWLGFAGAYVPITPIGLALLAVVGTQLFVWAVRAAVFVYELIPFKAT